MTEAETILKMIENADPADTAKLDEIDARVHEYLGYYWHGGGQAQSIKYMPVIGLITRTAKEEKVFANAKAMKILHLSRPNTPAPAMR